MAYSSNDCIMIVYSFVYMLPSPIISKFRQGLSSPSATKIYKKTYSKYLKNTKRTRSTLSLLELLALLLTLYVSPAVSIILS